MVDLSIVIASFNTKDLTIDCIKSVIDLTKGISYEIIVIDNASSDGSAEAFNKNKKVKLIKNETNLGFAKANNQGIKVASGKFILLLNSDTKLTSNILMPLVDIMEKHADIGVISCALKNKDGSLQATGGYFPTLLRVFTWMFFIDDLPIISGLISSYHPKISFYNTNHEMDWVTGAFFLTRKEIWQKRGLDEDYFMYVEEVDFCFRVKKDGWKVLYDPQYNLIHYGGASSTSSHPILSEFRGLKIFYKKHKPAWQSLVLRIILKIGAFLRIFLISPRIYKNAFVQV